jgi:regulator of nucleoside diphosphate kinase
MKTRSIIITEFDRGKLSELITIAEKTPRHGFGDLHALQGELDRAKIVADEDVPAGVITLYCRAELLDLDTGEQMEFTLVLPAEADVDEGRISVLAPLGTAMLGYRVGDKFEWQVPHGLRRLQVTNVSQAEAVMAVA